MTLYLSKDKYREFQAANTAARVEGDLQDSLDQLVPPPPPEPVAPAYDPFADIAMPSDPSQQMPSQMTAPTADDLYQAPAMATPPPPVAPAYDPFADSYTPPEAAAWVEQQMVPSPPPFATPPAATPPGNRGQSIVADFTTSLMDLMTGRPGTGNEMIANPVQRAFGALPSPNLETAPDSGIGRIARGEQLNSTDLLKAGPEIASGADQAYREAITAVNPARDVPVVGGLINESLNPAQIAAGEVLGGVGGAAIKAAAGSAPVMAAGQAVRDGVGSLVTKGAKALDEAVPPQLVHADELNALDKYYRAHLERLDAMGASDDEYKAVLSNAHTFRPGETARDYLEYLAGPKPDAPVAQAAAAATPPVPPVTPPPAAAAGGIPPVPPSGRTGKTFSSGVKSPAPELDDIFAMQARNEARRNGPGIKDAIKGLPRTLERKLADEYVELNKLGKDPETAIALFRGRGEAVAQRIDEHVTPVVDLLPDKQTEAEFNAKVRLGRDLATTTAKGPRALSGGTVDAADAQAKLAALEAAVGPKKWAQLEQADKLRQAGLDQLLEDKVAAGMISREVADQIKTEQPYYNPTRLDEMIAKGELKGAGKRMTVNSNKLRALTDTGSTADTENPLLSYVRAIAEGEYGIQTNKVATAILEGLKSSPEYASEVTRLPSVTLKTGADIASGNSATIAFRTPAMDVPGAMSLIKDGERQLWKLPESNPLIERAIKNLEPNQLHPVTEFFRVLNEPSRAAFTTFSPAFLLKNPLADIMGAYVRGGVDRVKRIPEGIYHAAKQDSVYQELRRAGGGGANFSGNRTPEAMLEDIRRTGGKFIPSWKDPREALLDLASAEASAITTAVTTDPNDPDYGKKILTNAAIFGLGRRPLKKANEILEQGTRIAGAQQVASKGGTKAEQALEYRRGTVDFSRMGEWVRAWNPVMMFLSARTGGALQVPRTLASVPEAKWRMAGVTSAIVGMYLLNRDHPEYGDVPRAVRQQNIVAMLPWSTKEKPAYFAYPARENAFASAIIVKALDQLKGDDPQGWDSFVGDYMNTFVPGAPGGESGSAALGTLPPMLKTPAEIAFNRNSFTGAPITPRSMEGVPSEERYTERTSELAKSLGERLNLSPIEIDYYLGSLGGGYGKALQAEGNAATGKPSSPTGNSNADMFLSGLFKQGGSQREADMYDALDKATKQFEPAVADLIRSQPGFDALTRDEQLRQLRAGQTELVNTLKDQIGITTKEKDLGLPDKYRGVSDPQQTAAIDSAISKVNAFESDPHKPRPTAEERRLASRYEDRINPLYTREKKARDKGLSTVKDKIPALLVPPPPGG